MSRVNPLDLDLSAMRQHELDAAAPLAAEREGAAPPSSGGNGGRWRWDVLGKVVGTVGAAAILALVAAIWTWGRAEVNVHHAVPQLQMRVGHVEGRVKVLEEQPRMSEDTLRKLDAFLDAQPARQKRPGHEKRKP